MKSFNKWLESRQLNSESSEIAASFLNKIMPKFEQAVGTEIYQYLFMHHGGPKLFKVEKELTSFLRPYGYEVVHRSKLNYPDSPTFVLGNNGGYAMLSEFSDMNPLWKPVSRDTAEEYINWAPDIKTQGKMSQIQDKRSNERTPGADMNTMLQPDEQDREYHIDPFWRKS